MRWTNFVKVKRTHTKKQIFANWKKGCSTSKINDAAWNNARLSDSKTLDFG